MRPNRSPWVEQLSHRAPAAPLDADTDTDVAIVGAGIAGIATAYFLLRDTDRRVLLIERDRVARGATGYNAGQIVSYFERPLNRLVAEFGFDLAMAAQRDVDAAWSLLEAIAAGACVREPVHRFTGHMGMFSLDHLLVHLESNLLRERAGLARERCRVSERAPFLGALPEEFAHLYEVVPQRAIAQLLETDDDRYHAVLSYDKGCTNSALVCEQIVEHLRRAFPQRFALFEATRATRIALDADHAELEANGRCVRASRVVLCSNGFVDHAIENRMGPDPVRVYARVAATVGYMAAFLEATPRSPSAISYLASPRIGHGQAYYYVTRHPYWQGGREQTLTCIGGPDGPPDERHGYDPYDGYSDAVLERLDSFIRPILAPGRTRPLAYDYTWHGLMAYTGDQVRKVGVEPRNPVLLYNLGCNGVGLLPSICGAERVARLVAGEKLEASLFDPR
jgi:glycine/D-amino acid oxidase-like deaminating enzyme